ncbi:uncharacterized protein LOC127742994 [Arachis duranensis]|uniref:Uncharacterized protein LOC127742994 n=1 Tax=Arachis duranensis TaxID=130453 RepID=A0A9C6TCN9_ARADU|nr:uncharacterized protein LOC127742994 [Arachis duranensis]
MTGVEGEKKYLKNDKLIDILKLNVAVLREIVNLIKGFVATGTNILQNIMYGTRLLINLDVPKAVIFQKSKSVYVAEHEVLYSAERKTIKELRAVADIGFYVVLTTVLDVEPVLNWWYKSCGCSVKVEANADTYFYDGCNKDVNNVVDKYKYKLNLLIFYGNTTTTFVVFDKEATALFGWTCTEMEKGEASKDPTGFKELFLDKEFLFKVKVETIGWCDSYDVSMISFDSTILARWRDTQGPGGIYCVTATGLEVIDQGDWWVPACKCGRTIMVIKATYYCGNCGCVDVAILSIVVKMDVLFVMSHLIQL